MPVDFTKLDQAKLQSLAERYSNAVLFLMIPHAQAETEFAALNAELDRDFPGMVADFEARYKGFIKYNELQQSKIKGPAAISAEEVEIISDKVEFLWDIQPNHNNACALFHSWCSLKLRLMDSTDDYDTTPRPQSPPPPGPGSEP
ncbi:MAG: hypothetical protein L6Q57_08820 [Alphaproteobacteria bacterium]|nr:hypothetical protein [Alphaproteobacteria bacterium]